MHGLIGNMCVVVMSLCCTMTQAVCPHLVTMVTQVQFHAIPSGICGGHIDTGADCS
jgi:hypothetical protein